MICGDIVRFPKGLCITAQTNTVVIRKSYLGNKTAAFTRDSAAITIVFVNDDEMAEFMSWFTYDGAGSQTYAIDVNWFGREKTIVGSVSEDLSESLTSSGAREIIFNIDIDRVDKKWDDIPPVLTLLGDNPMDIVGGGNRYVEPGATAIDNVEGDISSRININNLINDGAIGSYGVYYNVSDSFGNSASEMRTVNVTSIDDIIAPEITIIGSNPVTAELNSTYDDAGATALDNVDGDVTANIVTSDNVDTSVEGAYQVTYEVSDAAGNSSSATRTVNIVDTADHTPPVITLLGDNPMDLYVGDTYNEPGATATDDVDGDITANIVITGTVDTSTEGTYYKYYNVSDGAGNAADEKQRTVNVEEPPSGAQEFSNAGSSTFVVPDHVNSITVCAIGGGGGGSSVSDNANGNKAGGGHAGQIFSGSIDVTPGETLDVLIGYGGAGKHSTNAAGDAADDGPGDAGTPTTLKRGSTTLVSCNGGAGGTYAKDTTPSYGGDGATKPANCYGTYADGIREDGSYGFVAYGGEAGFADGSPGGAGNDGNTPGTKGSGGGSNVGANVDFWANDGGSGYMLISWGSSSSSSQASTGMGVPS